MTRDKKTSSTFFLLGLVALVGGALLSALLGRYQAAPVLGCSALMLAIAWIVERRSDSSGDEV
ncbi:hypothetical protein [Peterkaempfera bronchialis]|uniref:Uncharacterized protein n=1 Tax=Peterkaempfera bronchialis TaxID=2126346 RepID=A0A345SR58_9ACTN|nr:hypothetical protein [Peterkaempfera bronchialis]AXI76213.1 hypothetical protein C7M71_000700 [Peterkaempfera bronchialis]